MTPTLTRLVLMRPHTHAGKSHQAGDRIEVDGPTADWLIAHDIATPESIPLSMSLKTDPETKPFQRKEPKP